MTIQSLVRKDVLCGAQAPPGWRVAWHEQKRHIDVYSPLPLHWVLWVVRELFYRIRLAIVAPRVELAEATALQRSFEERERLADEYSRGYLAGWRECLEACLVAVNDLAPEDEVWAVDALLSDSVAKHRGN